MDDPHNQITDKSCEICGDIGRVDYSIICSKCKVTREHVYCMRVLYDDDRDKWVCEECNSSNHSSIKAPTKQPSGTRRITIKKPPQNSKVHYLPPEEAKVINYGATTRNLSSPRKVHIVHRPSGNKPSASKMEAIPSSFPTPKFRIKVGPSGSKEPLNDWSMPSYLKDTNLSLTEKDDSEPTVSRWSSATNIQTSDPMLQKETDEPAHRLKGESLPARRVSFAEFPKPSVKRDNIKSGHTPAHLGLHLPDVSSDGCVQQSRITTITAKYMSLEIFYRDDIKSGHKSQRVQSFPTGSSGVNVYAKPQPNKVDSKARDSLSVTMVLDSYLPNHPAMSPTWKGAFKIASDLLPCSVFDEIQAHPPCKVHSKVYKLSKQFPKILPFEMLPRKNSWVDFFEDDVPSELDIGLYFFTPRMSNSNGGSNLDVTSTVGHEQCYSPLLECLDIHEQLLRTQIDGVELFVFSSKHLPEDSRKINRKFFLWGLLRPTSFRKP
ncbi:uncharacterized protein LOC110703962 isoform X2 [Chenopodium quinoa]|uniref:uncharacterized protein LOC110703962 isoform X2 n=1 Tax=Chenopodium quinoa TaxID=63459 RepID=UPI000B772195|nr:uncharacterized protein LOC110703962 isoform X2 [Chenopodium quinoa]